MTPRERMAAALEGRIPDRIPTMELEFQLSRERLGRDFLTEEDLKKRRQRVIKVLPQNKTSTLQDIEAGRHTEVDIFAGTIMRLGEKYGVATPYNEMMYHMIKVLEEKNDGLFNT